MEATGVELSSELLRAERSRETLQGPSGSSLDPPSSEPETETGTGSIFSGSPPDLSEDSVSGSPLDPSALKRSSSSTLREPTASEEDEEHLENKDNMEENRQPRHLRVSPETSSHLPSQLDLQRADPKGTRLRTAGPDWTHEDLREPDCVLLSDTSSV